ATMKQPMSLVPAFASINNYNFEPAPVRKAAEPAKTEKVTPVEQPQTTQEPKTPEGSRSVVPAKSSSESAPELASPQAKMAVDAGKAAQKALLGFEEDQAFKSQGRSGNVDLFVRPQTTTERQVVCGKMSFGKEYTIEEIMQFMNDLALKETWDSQFQDGRVLETYAKSASFSLNLTWAAYKKEMGVAGRDF
ncbi:hypothetical protein FOZ63_020279, partial [Perkinsus olseni]